MKNQKGFLRFFHSLSRKFMLGFFVLALTILTTTCTVGYYVYRTNIQKIYNAQAYSAAYEARSLLDGDLLRKYSQTLEKDEEYEQLKASIETLRQNTGSIGIFIVRNAETIYTLLILMQTMPLNTRSAIMPNTPKYLRSSSNQSIMTAQI